MARLGVISAGGAASPATPHARENERMAIPSYVSARFETLRQAFEAGAVALMETTDAKTGATRYAICAVNRDHDGEGGYEFVPFGDLNASDNPYDDYIPPSAGDDDSAPAEVTPAPSASSAEAQVRETEATEREAAE